MKNKDIAVFGIGKESLPVLDKMNIEKLDINKIYVDEDMFVNLSIDDIENIILSNFYKCDTIICFGEIDLLEKMCKLFYQKEEFEGKMITAIIFDDNNKDEKINAINDICDNTLIMPSFYVDIITNTGNSEELAKDIVLTKCVKSISKFFVEKLRLIDDREYIFEFGKNNGFGTVFFETIFGDIALEDMFKYLKYNNECSIFCIAEGPQFTEEFKGDLMKSLMSYGRENQKSVNVLCDFCENKNIYGFNSITLFVLGY